MKARIIALFLVAHGCAGDGTYVGTFQPRDPEPTPFEEGLLFAVPEDTKLHYFFRRTYVPDSTATTGAGGIANEKQASGHLCAVIDDVQDNATEEFKDLETTAVNGRVRVVGRANNAEVEIGDQEAEDMEPPQLANPQTVDAAHNNLWLLKLTVPAFNHGYGEPKVVEFGVQGAPRPPDLSPALLPFFDVRLRAAENWGGWKNTEEGVVRDTFLADLSRGFLEEQLHIDFATDRSRYKFESTDPDPACAAATIATCPPLPQCFPDGASCLGLYATKMLWKERLSDESPVEMAGREALHSIQLQYTSQGVLRLAQEYILPDLGPEHEATRQFYKCAPGSTTNCSLRTMPVGCLSTSGQPCMQGDIDLQEMKWADTTPCRFPTGNE